jgi:hypothetical protein
MSATDTTYTHRDLRRDLNHLQSLACDLAVADEKLRLLPRQDPPVRARRVTRATCAGIMRTSLGPSRSHLVNVLAVICTRARIR